MSEIFSAAISVEDEVGGQARATKTDSNVLMLKTNMGAGHGESSGRYDALKDNAFRYGFILDQIGATGLVP